MSRLSKNRKEDLIRILSALILFAAMMAAEHSVFFHSGVSHGIPVTVAYLIPYFIVGYDVVKKCFIGIFHGQMFDESFLMTLATAGAFGCGEPHEAVAVMLFYQIGEFFQNYAVGKSRNAISELMSIAPDFANRENEDGTVEIIDPDEIEIGDTLIIKPGEKIPTDGIIIRGEGMVNTSALTGESVPRYAQEGDEVISGCINGETLMRIKALKAYDDSTVAQILDLVETASSKKSKTENFITRFSRYYTPAVVAGAVLLAFIPPIVSGNFAAEFGRWVLRACTFLVISCPCALVISVPLAFFGGIGAASKEGVLVKGSNYLEMMARLDTVVSDKTGTLTEGRFKVCNVIAVNGYGEDEILRYAAAVESGSTHPIGVAIAEACVDPFPPSEVSDVENYAGRGICASVSGDRTAVGNRRFFDELGISVRGDETDDAGTLCHVAINDMHIGTIAVSDLPKPEAERAIKDMYSEGIRRVVMLTGDSEASAAAVARDLGITDYIAGLLPLDKVNAVEKLLDEIAASRSPKGKLAFVGDGINDAPVLSRADIGIAMGSLGSDAAIEAADIVIMDDNIDKINSLIRIAGKTIGISKANIVFALSVKFICLALGAIGIANMWIAVFADVGVAVICILNSMRMIASRRSER